MRELEARWKERWGKEAPVIECGYGWDDLLLALDDELVKLDPTYLLYQVKEKFGGLRFYAAYDTNVSNKFHDLIAAAEEKSFSICESCGEPGECIVRHGWYVTRCEACL